MHFRLGVNVRHADQQLRGTIMLPHGTGRTARVAVFAQGDKAKEAEEAGADFVGADDLATKIQEGLTDFDVAIATPDMMVVVGRLGRILGPQGKMPNPKTGTVTMDVAKAVEEVKAGKIEYRTDRSGIVHVPIGKKSFEAASLVENYGAVLEEILRVKPSSAKGRYIKSITLASTMGPGVKVDTGRIRDLMEDDRPRAELATYPTALVARDRRQSIRPAQVARRVPPGTHRSVSCLRPPSLRRALVVHGGGEYMLKSQKAEIIDRIEGEIREASALIVADYRGLSVAAITRSARACVRSTRRSASRRTRSPASPPSGPATTASPAC